MVGSPGWVARVRALSARRSARGVLGRPRLRGARRRRPAVSL